MSTDDPMIHSYVLRGEPIQDVDALAERPEEFLLDIAEDPVAAAHRWRELRHRHGVAEGAVRIEWQGQQLIDERHWDDVHAIWGALDTAMDVFEGLVDAEELGADPMCTILPKGSWATFTFEGRSTSIDPRSVLPALRAHLDERFRWLTDEVGAPPVSRPARR